MRCSIETSHTGHLLTKKITVVDLLLLRAACSDTAMAMLLLRFLETFFSYLSCLPLLPCTESSTVHSLCPVTAFRHHAAYGSPMLMLRKCTGCQQTLVLGVTTAVCQLKPVKKRSPGATCQVGMTPRCLSMLGHDFYACGEPLIGASRTRWHLKAAQLCLAG